MSGPGRRTSRARRIATRPFDLVLQIHRDLEEVPLTIARTGDFVSDELNVKESTNGLDGMERIRWWGVGP